MSVMGSMAKRRGSNFAYAGRSLGAPDRAAGVVIGGEAAG